MKRISKFLAAIIVLTAYSCEDIMEEDITDDMVTAIYPQNNQQIESNVVNFQWSELNGADKYRIQVYSTSQSVVLDSLVSGNNFTYALTAGNYQWRVRGENFAYETAYTFPMSFTLIETSDLSGQQVQLSTPSSGVYTQNTSLTFSWLTVNAATNYDFQLINVSQGNILVHEQNEITGTSLTLNNSIITQDGQYMWKVKAINTENSTETPFATRVFYLDRAAPNQPQNNMPANNATVQDGDAIDFEWSDVQDTGTVSSSITYSIQIATDQGFGNIINTSSISIPSYTYTFETIGNYYWRVRATDQAGNNSNYSSSFKINVQ
ncbi:hypothetical protein AAEO56_11625 [Flavobacterium sp. DGU11]|uniref:Fibronectin type-III domain-containing protein n=1 Tax=Flavobacterium arundinis TaxID=3139143 RepID=A0ABU9HYC6_9FLAO